MAVKTKALATLYYAQAPKYSYWDGCSTGGRQAHMEAQANPEDFDGILGGDPAMNWTRFITSELYPQIVIQRDLGGVILTPAQLTLVSSAAVSACDSALNGRHDGYISDPGACNYDPTHDRNVLCKADGGTNDTASCVTPTQALAINKMWYGQTPDGSVPDPKVDNGHSDKLTGKQLWFGPSRGTALAGGDPHVPTLAASMNGQPFPFLIALDVLALELQNPRVSGATFHNASGNGENGWKSLSYAALADAQAKGMALQKQFGNIDTDNPDLTKFRDHKGKMIVYHGLADQLIPAEGTTAYYRSVADKMGGIDKIQDFYRYYQIPGMGHCLGTGSVDGTSGVGPAAAPPLPVPYQLFSVLVDWVEKGKAPEDIVVRNASGTNSRPLCVYPKKITYKGTGDVMAASSYRCE
jgi:feruloyl esterase